MASSEADLRNGAGTKETVRGMIKGDSLAVLASLVVRLGVSLLGAVSQDWAYDVALSNGLGQPENYQAIKNVLLRKGRT